MDYVIELEIRDGKPVISMPDVAALISGRLLLAWGELDFRIEALIDYLQVAFSNRQAVDGLEPEPPNADGRAKHRRAVLRRLFREICSNNKKAMSEYDKLAGLISKIENIRSSIAHGITLGSEEAGKYNITAWVFSATDEPIKRRDSVLKQYTFDDIISATSQIHSARESLEEMIQSYGRAFIFKTMEIYAAKSLAQ